MIVIRIFLFSALKKMNEKKQVFNMYKTQKAKEEKVTITLHVKFYFMCKLYCIVYVDLETFVLYIMINFRFEIFL